jgi:hypothetical protein
VGAVGNLVNAYSPLLLPRKDSSSSASCRLSGKAMARTGLRMMPTFPSPPLKFRTVGFPQSGLKAGISDAAFPAIWFAIVLRALCCHALPLRCVRNDALMSTSGPAVLPLYPRGPRSGPGYAVPVHLHLLGPIRPTRRHIRTSPTRGLYPMPSVHICICLGDPRLLPSFHRRSFAACRPPRPRGTLRLPTPSTSPKTLAFNSVSQFRHSLHPHTPILVRGKFSGLNYGSLALRPAALLALLSELTGIHPAIKSFYFRASNGLVALPVAGYHYSANWVICTGGTHTR